MGSRKIIMLVGSILIGALAGFALLSYVQGVEQEVQESVARVPVFVIAGDVTEGETASSVTQTNRIVQAEIESSFRPQTAVTNLEQIQGRIAVSDLAANQVLVAGMFEDPETVSTSYSDLIANDHVAFSMNISKDRAVNGFVEPGDFVDIVVLGAPPSTPGDEDAFETSAASSPYTSPARYLYRGVRIVSINDDIVGQSRPLADGTTAAATGPESTDAGTLNITLAVPVGAAQRILSVDAGSIVLSLLPGDWDPAAQANEVLEEILIDAELPGENPTLITPDGPEGFVDQLAEELEAAEDEDAVLPGSTSGTEDAAPDESAEEDSQ